VSLSIAGVSAADNQAWDAAYSACEHATFFHSRAWAESWAAGSGQPVSPEPLQVRFSDRAIAILPLSRLVEFRGLDSVLLSSPGGTFGGWIAEQPLTPEHGGLLTRFLLDAGRHNLSWRLNPYDPHSPSALDGGEETLVLDISGGFDALQQAWRKRRPALLRKVRKARDAGVTVRRADSDDDWQAYDAVYRASLARWGERATAAHPRSLFQALARRGSPEIALWLAEHEGRVIAGALCLQARSHAVYWHGAALAEDFPLRPVNLLLHEAIRHACERGCCWFDFNPSAGQQGVIAFKRSLGGKPRPAPLITVEGARRAALRSLRGRLCGSAA